MSKAAEMFDRRFDAVKDGVKHFIDAGSDRAQDLRDGAMTGVDRVAKVIQKHPFAAIGIAFGFGYIAMRIARR